MLISSRLRLCVKTGNAQVLFLYFAQERRTCFHENSSNFKYMMLNDVNETRQHFNLFPWKIGATALGVGSSIGKYKLK